MSTPLKEAKDCCKERKSVEVVKIERKDGWIIAYYGDGLVTKYRPNEILPVFYQRTRSGN